MIERVIFPEEYKKSQIMFFKEADFTSLPNTQVVPLFGPNGVGKTTMLDAILHTLRHEEVYKRLTSDNDDGAADFYKSEFDREKHKAGCEVITDGREMKLLGYKNSVDNFRSKNVGFDPYLLNARFDAQSVSEGQSIVYSLFDLFELLKEGAAEDETDNIVFLDEMDSGLSIDNLDTFMRKIKNIVRKRSDVQFIMSFNNPRVLKFFPYVVSMYDGKVKELHSDEDMLAEMKRNKKMFDRARRKTNGMPKIYE